MASTHRGIKTYHPVPRFDMAEDGGPLFLGAIFQDLKFLRPALNRDAKHRVEVRDALLYRTVTQEDFRESRASSSLARLSAWFKCNIGASAKISGSRDADNVVPCEKITTTYFDPDDQYLDDCFEAYPIKEYLAGSSNRTAELYLITGLKVGKNIGYAGSKTSRKEVSLHVAAQNGQSGVGAGAETSRGARRKHSQEFQATDIVVAYRVHKFRCKRHFNFNHENRRLKNDGVVAGQMMADQECEARQAQVHYEAVPIPEEAATLEGAIGGDTEE